MEKHKILVSKVGVDFRGKPQIRGESASHGWISSTKCQNADNWESCGSTGCRMCRACGRHSACGLRFRKRSDRCFDYPDEHIDRIVRTYFAVGAFVADRLPCAEGSSSSAPAKISPRRKAAGTDFVMAKSKPDVRAEVEKRSRTKETIFQVTARGHKLNI